MMSKQASCTTSGLVVSCTLTSPKPAAIVNSRQDCVKHGPSSSQTVKNGRLALVLIASSTVLEFILLLLGFASWCWDGTADLVC